MIVTILGDPGSGKGTQVEMIQARYRNALTIGMSRELEPIVQRQPDLQVMRNNGGLLPDHVVIETFRRALPEAIPELAVVEGFPRTAEQARWFGFNLQGHRVAIVLSLKKETALGRIAERKIALSGASRKDDQHPEGRLAIYRANLDVILAKLRKAGVIIHRVDAEPSKEDVADQVLLIIQREMGVALGVSA